MNRAERRRQEKMMAKAGGPSLSLVAKNILDEALSHHRAGQIRRAEQLYRDILGSHPTHADTLHLLGLAVHQQSDHVQACELIRRAIQQDKSNPLYHYNLGLVCEAMGQLEEAADAYQHALQHKPHYVEALSNLGNVYRQQGKLDAAISAYRQTLTIKPDYAGGYNNLGVVLKEIHDLDGAIEAYQHSLRLNPQNAQSYYNLGMVLLQQTKPEDAAHAFRKAIELDPAYAKAHHNLGLGLLWQGHQELALSHFRTSADLLQNHGQAIPVRHVFPSRIKHDAEQLEYLHGQGISLQVPETYGETLQALRRQVTLSQEDNPPLTLTASQSEALAPSFNRILHYAQSQSLPYGSLNPELDLNEIQDQYCAGQPEIIYVDSLLREEALQSLRRFCLESTIWKKDYGEGYVGAFLSEGFSSPLLLQVAEELRAKFPRIFHHHYLLQAWAFKQDSQRLPLNIHADAAAVNVNFWITPDEANLDRSCGGLVVWDKEAPKDWDFKVYNSSQYKPKIMEFLRESGASPVRVPYRENRALIFNSDLFHESDRCVFRDDYQSRRINITFLYGHRA